MTYREDDPMPEARLEALIREAARIAAMSREERIALLFDRDSRPAV